MKKLIMVTTLIMTICLLLLGVIFKNTASRHEGISASVGIVVDGNYKETSSGKLGADREKNEVYDTGGTIFYVLSSITGVICIASFIADKKSKK